MYGHQQYQRPFLDQKIYNMRNYHHQGLPLLSLLYEEGHKKLINVNKLSEAYHSVFVKGIISSATTTFF